MLLHHVRELEGQLAAERLLLRGHELEGEVARPITLKGRMRVRINELTMLILSVAAADAPQVFPVFLEFNTRLRRTGPSSTAQGTINDNSPGMLNLPSPGVF